MRLFEKFKMKLVNSKLYKWKLLGFCFLEYEKSNDNHHIKFYSQKHKISKNNIACYLKVNRLREYTFLCIQHWINIMNEIPNVDLYIVCDNDKLKKAKNGELCTRNWIDDAYNRISTDQDKIDNSSSQFERNRN